MSPWCPTDRTTRRKPASASSSSNHARNGRPATGAIALGMSGTRSRRRVPSPPASTTASINASSAESTEPPSFGAAIGEVAGADCATRAIHGADDVHAPARIDEEDDEAAAAGARYLSRKRPRAHRPPKQILDLGRADAMCRQLLRLP